MQRRELAAHVIEVARALVGDAFHRETANRVAERDFEEHIGVVRPSRQPLQKVANVLRAFGSWEA